MILQRYLYREILKSFAAVLALLVLIYVSTRFVRFLGDAAAGKITAAVIAQLLALKVSVNLVLLLPLALYVAVLLGLGRLYKDSEVVAITAGGIGIERLAGKVFWLALVFAFVAMVLSLYVSPLLAGIVDERQERAEDEAELAGIYPGRFKEFGRGDRILYVEHVDAERSEMYNVFVQVREPDRTGILVAERARHTVDSVYSGRFAVLIDGYRYEGTPGEVDYVITEFREHAVRIDEESPKDQQRSLEAIPSSELFGSDDPVHIAELQWRISLPISVLVLGILGVPLARTGPGGGLYGKLFAAVLVYFFYNNMVGVAQKLVERGDLHPVIGVWSVHIVVIALALVLIHLHSARSWRIARAWRKRRAGR